MLDRPLRHMPGNMACILKSWKREVEIRALSDKIS